MGFEGSMSLGDVAAASLGGVGGALIVDYMVPGASGLHLAAGAIGGAVGGVAAKRGAEATYGWLTAEEQGESAFEEFERRVDYKLDAKISRAVQTLGEMAAAEREAADKRLERVIASIKPAADTAVEKAATKAVANG